MMAVKVLIPTALRQFAGGQSEIEIEGATVGEVLDRVTQANGDLRKNLYSDEGRLRSFVNVYVNDEDIRGAARLETPVKDGDTVSLSYHSDVDGLSSAVA